MRWTCVLQAKAGYYLLGGYDKATRNYIFQKWDIANSRQIATLTAQVADHFTPSTIDHALFAEDCCGADIFEVANLEWIRRDELAIVVLGGGGEYLGACQSACAVAVLDTGNMAIRHSQVLDTEDGGTGLLRASDGAFIAQCLSDLYILRPQVEYLS